MSVGTTRGPRKQALSDAVRRLREHVQDGELLLVQADVAKTKTELDVAEQEKVLAIGLALACDKGKHSVIEFLLSQGADPNLSATSRAPPLRRAVKSCAAERVVQLLLDHGAKVDATDNEGKTPLMYAKCIEIVNLLLDRKANVEAKDHDGNTALMNHLLRDQTSDMAKLLIDRGADIEAVDNVGRSILFTAVWKNHLSIVEMLLFSRGLDVSKMDERRRNVWHHLAIDVARRFHDEGSSTGKILDLLLRATRNKDVAEAQDVRQRTALHWAASFGNILVAKVLLERMSFEVDAREHRARTPLHLAVRFADTVELEQGESASSTGSSARHQMSPTAVDLNRSSPKRQRRPFSMRGGSLAKLTHERARLLALPEAFITLLLKHGANVDAETDARWTVLHTACAEQPFVSVVERLLVAGAQPNAKTQSGKTPFHLACEAGRLDIVKFLLEKQEVHIDSKDNFGNTPLLGAATSGHVEIVRLLAPWTERYRGRLTDEARRAAESFTATVVDFDKQNTTYKRRIRHRKATVYDLLYADPSATKSSTVCGNSDRADFRWIHLPVNNVTWCHELLTKRFIEEGSADVEGFKVLERSFLQQHRGQRVHANYMRPVCRTVPRSRNHVEKFDEVRQSPIKDREGKPPKSQEGTVQVPRMVRSSTGLSTTTLSTNGDAPKIPMPRRSSTMLSVALEREAEQAVSAYARRKSQPGTGRAHNPMQEALDRSAAYPEHNTFMFAPYLHFETDARRREMQAAMAAVQRADLPAGESRRIVTTLEADRKALQNEPDYVALIKAHLPKTLHIRRTLDQSFYRTIETNLRDTDQVVYRYGKSLVEQGHCCLDDVKVLMRWRQPPKDSLNVLEGIMEEIYSATGDSVDSVYELAVLVAGRCFGTFDQSTVRSDGEGSRFLDMFESSIGKTMDDETHLFANFDEASREVSDFLQGTLASQSQQVRESKEFRKPRAAHKQQADPVDLDRMHKEQSPRAMQTLLDIAAEIKLLSDVKDIRDELDMLKLIFQQQTQVIPGIYEAVETIIVEETIKKSKIRRRIQQHERAIDRSVQEIERMDKPAERIYISIRDLLDLKQKHANAVEASYARIQASETARQTSTLMVFTVVTVIFLPLSFIAAFFDLDIAEFPHSEGGQEMSLGYALKYILGFGGAVAMVCVVLALSTNRMKRSLESMWSGTPAFIGKGRRSPDEGTSAPKHCVPEPTIPTMGGVRSRSWRTLRPASMPADGVRDGDVV